METPSQTLPLDDGGVRGISFLYLLKTLMIQVSLEYVSEDGQSAGPISKPTDYFDLICGTSAGGFIALMLGRLRTVNHIFDWWLTNSLSTMQSKNIRPSPRNSSRGNLSTKRHHLMPKSSLLKSKNYCKLERGTCKDEPLQDITNDFCRTFVIPTRLRLMSFEWEFVKPQLPYRFPLLSRKQPALHLLSQHSFCPLPLAISDAPMEASGGKPDERSHCRSS